MSLFDQEPEAPPAPRSRPFLTAVAWLIILSLAVFSILAPRGERAKGSAEDDASQHVVREAMGRYLVGVREMIKKTDQQMVDVPAKLPGESPLNDLSSAILKAELEGPAAALEELDAFTTPDDHPKHEELVRLHDILLRLYQAYMFGDPQATRVTAEERAELKAKLGWFGELALHPPPLRRDVLAAAVGAPAALALVPTVADTPDRQTLLEEALQTVTVIAGSFCMLIGLSLAGLAILISLIVQAKRGNLQNGLGDPVSYHGIYAETFALWLAVFLGMTMAAEQALPDLTLLVRGAVALLASLIVLIWPVLRGIPWTQVRRDIGWTLGTQATLEPAYGLLCYVGALPILMVGLIIVLLSGAQGLALLGQEVPTHPIVAYLTSDDPAVVFQVFFLACVAAPFVEETMFRGVFYRHVRDLSRPLGSARSFLASALFVSFYFAVIHPQGVMAVPALMALAIGFSIAREWRGTLIPCMVAHGLSNGLVLLMGRLALAR